MKQTTSEQPKVPSVPAEEHEKRAAALLDTFSQFTGYRHGAGNPYLQRLGTIKQLTRSSVIEFLCIWHSFSKRAPQMLLFCAAAYTEQSEWDLIMKNFLEEAGLVRPGDDPHSDLLKQLIEKLGGKLTVDERAEQLCNEFMSTLGCMTPAQATGVMSGLEHPALDISGYLHQVIRHGGYPESLLRADPYCSIHLWVEILHIEWSHGNSLRYMERGQKEEVVAAFQSVMRFWKKFWKLAFSSLREVETASSVCPRAAGIWNGNLFAKRCSNCISAACECELRHKSNADLDDVRTE